MKKISLKVRLCLLVAIGFFIPLFVLWFFTNHHVGNLYRENTNVIIDQELGQIKENIDLMMDSLKYTSQQIATDSEIADSLRKYLDPQSTEIQRVISLRQMREKITLYETSSPNIGNITFLMQNADGTISKINETSLVSLPLPSEDMRLTTQNQMVYYGPHTTLSRVSDYPVVSLLRRITFFESPDVYVYIESGFRQLKISQAQTLNQLDAVYTVFSDTGNVVFSSQQELIPEHQPLSDESVFADPHEYNCYQIFGWSGWSLQVFVPVQAYNHYLRTLSFGFVVFGLVGAIFTTLVVAVIWHSVYYPLRLFEQNLQDIISSDLEADIQTIHVQEFDQNFEYFSTMKQRIENLIQLAQRQEQEKSRLEIKQLISKMNPHFVNNTLDTLRWYAEEKGYRDVYDFLSAFNRLLVYNMEKSKVTTLQIEINAVNDYIILQKMKYDIEYQTEINLPAPMLNTEMPRFILQPLVENAIFHGVEGRGKIKMKIGLLPDGNIYIRIINNGYPLDVDKIQEIMRTSKDLSSNGIGIQYVVRMLEAQFPGMYQFNVSTENGENQVEIVIPFCRGDYYAKNINS